MTDGLDARLRALEKASEAGDVDAAAELVRWRVRSRTGRVWIFWLHTWGKGERTPFLPRFAGSILCLLDIDPPGLSRRIASVGHLPGADLGPVALDHDGRRVAIDLGPGLLSESVMFGSKSRGVRVEEFVPGDWLPCASCRGNGIAYWTGPAIMPCPVSCEPCAGFGHVRAPSVRDLREAAARIEERFDALPDWKRGSVVFDAPRPENDGPSSARANDGP